MSFVRVLKIVGAYVALVFAACLLLVLYLRVNRTPGEHEQTVVSIWQSGIRVARAFGPNPDALLKNETKLPGATRVYEHILGEAPILALHPLVLGASLIPERDGLKVSYEGRVAYATPDDILKLQAYEPMDIVAGVGVRLSVDSRRVIAALASELKVKEADLTENGVFRRIAVQRKIVGAPPVNDAVTPANLREAVLAAALYLARHLQPDGLFRYEVDATSGQALEGYSWPRHAGATSFLTEAGDHTKNAEVRKAAVIAARRMSQFTTGKCGERSCVGEGDQVDLGSSALALLTYAELVRTGIGPEFRADVERIADFIRSQQRPDGEFMHFYDRVGRRAVDMQVQYYSGEAALALARAHRVTKMPEDLAAAKRALEYLVSKPALFVGARYYWAAEHWTCQTLEELWERAPNHEALRFCLNWQEFIRAGVIEGRVAAPEYEGACGRGPFLSPRLTLSASRMEAGVATLAAAKLAGISASEIETLENQVRKTLGFLLRYQLRPGPSHLMPDPKAMHGGFPGSVTELRVRIDFPQHAGAALLRYLKLLESRRE